MTGDLSDSINDDVPVPSSRKLAPDVAFMPFLEQFVPVGLRSRIVSLSMQSLARHIEDSTRHADWIGEFNRKYGL